MNGRGYFSAIIYPEKFKHFFFQSIRNNLGKKKKHIRIIFVL